MKKVNWKTTITLTVILILVYVVTRYFLTNYYTPEWSARHFFWLAALVVFTPLFSGDDIFSITTLMGYLIGMLAGELFGGFQQNIPPHYLHYGWLIHTMVFFFSCLLGSWLQSKNKREIYHASEKISLPNIFSPYDEKQTKIQLWNPPRKMKK